MRKAESFNESLPASTRLDADLSTLRIQANILVWPSMMGLDVNADQLTHSTPVMPSRTANSEGIFGVAIACAASKLPALGEKKGI